MYNRILKRIRTWTVCSQFSILFDRIDFLFVATLILCIYLPIVLNIWFVIFHINIYNKTATSYILMILSYTTLPMELLRFERQTLINFGYQHSPFIPLFRKFHVMSFLQSNSIRVAGEILMPCYIPFERTLWSSINGHATANLIIVLLSWFTCSIIFRKHLHFQSNYKSVRAGTDGEHSSDITRVFVLKNDFIYDFHLLPWLI